MKIEIQDCENLIQYRNRAEGGQSILNELKIANFTETLDLIPKTN